ncbi:MAG: hypothetical protein SO125_06170 [Eubacteriales bacterium]|nr:hypothetical protein [Eubacteriales bacterium]MDY4898532.1 hypothetical protein [Eubacteriales bacterium]
MELDNLIIDMCSLMSVTGYETYDRAALLKLIGGSFDECREDSVGNQVFVRRCGRPGAPRILLDTHMDEIGLMVSEILEGGFVRVVNIGGVDTRILQTAEVIIYGNRPIHAVIASTPPHLQKAGDSKKLPEVTELLVDTGYSRDELESIIRIGSPVGFVPKYLKLLGGHIAGKGLDDKSCAACAAYAVMNAPTDRLAGDVFLQLSVHEETGRVGGAAASTYTIDPDYAMVIDVNLGRTPDTNKRETVAMGGGASLTISPVTHKQLTRMTGELAAESGIKVQYCVSAGHTGTNSPDVALTRSGVPVVDVGLPLASMHTCCEVVSMEDCRELSNLVTAFICSEKIAEVFKNAKT